MRYFLKVKKKTVSGPTTLVACMMTLKDSFLEIELKILSIAINFAKPFAQDSGILGCEMVTAVIVEIS